MNDNGQLVLYALVTGSRAARDIGKLVDLAQSDGWDVCVIASPKRSRNWIDTSCEVSHKSAVNRVTKGARRLPANGPTVHKEYN
jgi:hypothetical protein